VPRSDHHEFHRRCYFDSMNYSISDEPSGLYSALGRFDLSRR
jgi:hypothetical protein